MGKDLPGSAIGSVRGGGGVKKKAKMSGTAGTGRKKNRITGTYQRQCGAVNHDAFGKADARWIISQLGFLGRTEQSGFSRRLHTHVHRKANDI